MHHARNAPRTHHATQLAEGKTMARHRTHKSTHAGKERTIERRCARHAKTGTLNHNAKTGRARAGR